MSLMEKLKNIFKKDEKLLEKPEEVIVSPCKYKNMTLYAPPRTIYQSDSKKFNITALDENNAPIVNEEILFSISNEKFTTKTNEEGLATIDYKLIGEDFKKGKHKLLITFPNGDYSQKIESQLTYRPLEYKVKAAKTKKKRKKKPPTFTSINAPKMKMYINSEGQYYVKLRNLKGRPISNETVTMTIKDDSYDVKTDEMGFARLDIEGLKSGTYKVHSKFKGNSEYDPCEATSEIQMIIRDIDKETIIEVKNLTMEFKVTKDKIDTLKELIIRTIKRNKETQEKIKVLDNISFNVYKGDKLGILGFNGAGKSTLLKIMSGIYEPTSGSITTKGKIAPLLELGAGFDKNYTGKNNIFLNGALLSIDEKTIKEKYDEILEFSELGEFINYPIKNYSSGMRTKLGFSIATTINPDILIIDEILSVGDIKFKKKSAEKINSMMQDGATVLLVSHSINQMKKICDRCIWLEDGKIKMEGEAEEVCAAYVKSAKSDV